MDHYHSLYIYTHQGDRVDLAVRCSHFLRPGEAFCTLLAEETQQGLARILRETGNSHLIWEETFGTPSAIFSHPSHIPRELSEYFYAAVSKAQQHEYNGICIVIDMASLTPDFSEDTLLSIERTLSSLLHLPLRCICLYPRSRLSPSFLAQLERQHLRTGFSDTFARGLHIYTAEPETQETNNIPSFHSPSVRKALLLLAYSGSEGWEAFQRIGNNPEPPRLRIAPPGGHDMVWTADKHFSLSYVSPDLQRSFDVSPDGIPGAPLDSLIGQDLVDRLASWEPETPEPSNPWPPHIHYQGTLETGEDTIREFTCTVAPILFDQKIIGYTGEINLFNEAPSDELHYDKAFEKMRPVWEGLPLGVTVIDDNSQILFSNRSFSRHISEAEVPPGTLLEEMRAFHGSSLTEKLENLDFERSHYHHISTSFQSRSGYRIKTSVQVILLDGSSNRSPRYLCIFLPLSERAAGGEKQTPTAASLLMESSGWLYYGTTETEDFLTSAGISSREREIIALLLRGYRNREIGESLNIAEITVKKHLSHIYRKLEVKNRFDLIRILSRYPSS